MKKIIGLNNKLLIALNPSAIAYEEKRFTELMDITSLDVAVSYSNTDSKYFHNGGDTVSLVTGRSISVNVAIEYDSTNEVHNYLKSLVFNNDINSVNNQYIEIHSRNEENKIDKIYGKACFGFKKIPVSGAADELSKIELEIKPQDTSFMYVTNNNVVEPRIKTQYEELEEIKTKLMNIEKFNHKEYDEISQNNTISSEITNESIEIIEPTKNEKNEKVINIENE